MNYETQNFQIIFLSVVAVVAFISLFLLFYIKIKLKRFFLGKQGNNLEETLTNLEKHVSKLQLDQKKIEEEIIEINKKIKKSIRGLEVARFNPFPDQGSNQSFAIGLLNDEGRGVIISSLYYRDRMSVFAKPIKNGNSEYELTDEERNVLEKAKAEID